MTIGQTAKLKVSIAESPWLAGVVLAISICGVYARVLDVPFIFDDHPAITRNRSITVLWPMVGTTDRRGPLNPPPQLPTSARPLVNLSFAVNYFFGGLRPVAFHAVNVVIHFLSALLLWAITLRTLQLPYFGGRFERSAGWLALALATLWALHPLQTEAVIYATQRTELMFALFYLATLYCSLRYWLCLPLPAGCRQGEGRGENALAGRQNERRRNMWLVLAIVACLAGMASKEVMVSAPLMVLLYERTFIAGSLPNALRRSWPLYVGLAFTWILLVALNIRAPRSQSAGFNLEVNAYSWWLTQTKVLLMYLKLVVWPSPLLIHYDFAYFKTLAQSWMYVLPVLLLGLATLVLLWRNDPIGYLGTWMFAILSPTLLIPITTEMAAERRMYLPLVAIVALAVVGGYALLQTRFNHRTTDRHSPSGVNWPRLLTVLPAFLLAIVFALVSSRRLNAYYQEPTLWQEVLQYYPEDFMAQFYRGNWLAKSDRPGEAAEVYKGVLVHSPNDVDLMNNLAVVLMRLGRYLEGIQYAQYALQLQPDATDVHMTLGLLYGHVNRLPESIAELQTALATNPNDIEILNHLADVLVRAALSEAIEVMQRAVRMHPANVDAHFQLGSALAGIGKKQEAIDQFRQTVELNANYAEAHFNLGVLLNDAGLREEAIVHLGEAVRLQPDLVEARNGLAEVLRINGRPDQAIEHYEAAVRLRPDFIAAYANLAKSLAAVHRSKEAITTAEKALEVAHSTGQAAAARQIEDWLKQYQAELQRSGNNAASSTSTDHKLEQPLSK